MTAAPQKEPALDPPDVAAELARLFPDERVSVHDPETGAAVALTVREFRFLEGLKATADARPFIEDYAALVGDGPEPEVAGSLEIAALLGKHDALWLELTARACGRETRWLARLADALALRDAMWSANGAFFEAGRRPRARAADGDGEPVPLARVLDTLVRAGHGRGHRDIARRLTWRQIETFYAEAVRREAEALALRGLTGAG